MNNDLWSALDEYHADQETYLKSTENLKQAIRETLDTGVSELSLARDTGLSRNTIRKWRTQ